ncbi:MAG: hypothetical protein ACERK9_11660 [Deltaproteobacteria bacterium]
MKNPGPEDGEQKTAGSRQDSVIRELVKEVRSQRSEVRGQRSEVRKQPVTNNIPYCSPFTACLELVEGFTIYACYDFYAFNGRNNLKYNRRSSRLQL